MKGYAKMKIQEIAIEKINGSKARSIGARLLQSKDEDCYLIFVQKIDSGIELLGNSCTSVAFR